jgi:hypothetical protein
MHLRFLVPIVLVSTLFAQTKPPAPPDGGDFSNAKTPPIKVPSGVILVKGAWSSASDKTTPLPEGGSIASNVYTNDYFGIRYQLPAGWAQRFEGPPPSDSGRYVLAQIRPIDRNGSVRGTILVSAQDIFFSPLPADVQENMTYVADHLQADYRVDRPLSQATIAGHSFGFLSYWSPSALLHWYVVSTEIRCHAVEFILSSQDTKLLDNLLQGLGGMTLPAEAGLTAGKGGGATPVCIKGFAHGENLLQHVSPIFSEPKFNPVPVRIIIDRKGRVRHIHFLSAFPDQTKAITDALSQWRFKPYVVDGHPVEVETGIMFGRSARAPGSQQPTDSVE